MADEAPDFKTIEISFRDLREDTEAWKRSIPAMVFLNHFFALSYHLNNDPERYDLNRVGYFSGQRIPQNIAADIHGIRNVLYNAWTTEYSMRVTGEQESGDYLRYALHWTFPQAYYSVMLTMQAYYMAAEIPIFNTEVLEKEFGRQVLYGNYPDIISFYAIGNYDDFAVHGLPEAHLKNSLIPVLTEDDAQSQIALFLRTTRKIKSWELRDRIQSNQKTAIRNTRTGKVVQKFMPHHWKQITDRLGPTTLLDMLSRLEISANHMEIQRFMQAEIDFVRFHFALRRIVGYLNFVHESYLAQSIGIDRYKIILSELPARLKGGFIEKRFEEYIQPLFQA